MFLYLFAFPKFDGSFNYWDQISHDDYFKVLVSCLKNKVKNNTFVNNGNKWLSTAQHKAVGEGHPKRVSWRGCLSTSGLCKGWKPITYTAGRAFSARGFWSGGGRGNTISLGEREGRLFFYIDRSGIGWSRPIFCILQRLCAPMFTGHENRHEGRGQLFLVFLVQIQSSWLVYTFCRIVLEVHWPYHWMQHSIAIFFCNGPLGEPVTHLWNARTLK